MRKSFNCSAAPNKTLVKCILFLLLLTVILGCTESNLAGEARKTEVAREATSCGNDICDSNEEKTCPDDCKKQTWCKDSDGGVYPLVKGECLDSRGVTVQDKCLGDYVHESFCLTPDMRKYCKQYNSEEYCDNLPNDCYALPLDPEPNLAWSYFPRDTALFCEYGCENGVCIANITPNTFEYDNYDASDRIAYFTEVATGSKREVMVNPDGSSDHFVNNDYVYVLQVLNVSVEDSPINIDTDADGELDTIINEDDWFVLSEPAIEDNTHEYENYDASDRVIDFQVLGTGTNVQVQVNPNGSSDHFIYKNTTYLLQVLNVSVDDSPIDLDTNGDGDMDTIINEGDEFGLTAPIATSECDDAIDNDGDGFIDYPYDPGCHETTTLAEDNDVFTGCMYDWASVSVAYDSALGDALPVVTKSEMPVLDDSVVNVEKETYTMEQKINLLKDPQGHPTDPITFTFDENKRDQEGYWLVIDNDNNFFHWQGQFSPALQAPVLALGAVDALEGETLNLLGEPFEIVHAERSVDNSMKLHLIRDGITYEITEGETVNLTFFDNDYEIVLLYIDDVTQEAKFMVNGMVTTPIAEGESRSLNNGVRIGVIDVDGTTVSYYLALATVNFRDTNIEDSESSSQVKVNNAIIDDVDVQLNGKGTNTELTLESIEYRVEVNSQVGARAYVRPGHGLREYLDEPDALLATNFDFVFYDLIRLPSGNAVEDAEAEVRVVAGNCPPTK